MQLTTKQIAEIRYTLKVIQLQTRALHADLRGNDLYKLDLIIRQLKRIDKLLPVVKFEEGKE